MDTRRDSGTQRGAHRKCRGHRAGCIGRHRRAQGVRGGQSGVPGDAWGTQGDMRRTRKLRPPTPPTSPVHTLPPHPPRPPTIPPRIPATSPPYGLPPPSQDASVVSTPPISIEPTQDPPAPPSAPKQIYRTRQTVKFGRGGGAGPKFYTADQAMSNLLIFSKTAALHLKTECVKFHTLLGRGGVEG